MQAENMSQLCNCEELKRTRRIRRGVVCLILGLLLLAVAGWHVADFFMRPQLIGEPHNALGYWVAKVFQAPASHSQNETQKMFGQFAGQAMSGVAYYIVIFGLLSIGWTLFQGGCQMLWRGLKKEPQPCPHCGSTR